ncbi:hypothetical protein GGR56DRAFT_531337 [Xylariaceae sp. FL0804]|nr:hypothetical protein GGR56DRAFT_531337 [Xylariaceae sp. FL0804]
MPKHTRSSSSSHHHHRYSNPQPMPASIAPSTSIPIYNTRTPLDLNAGLGASYFTAVPSTAAALPPMPAQAYDPYPEAAVVTTQAPVSHRPSSGAWTPQDDQNLLAARQQGLNWAQIQSTYFPSKTPNACRKRHERLLERKGADDWDSRKLERLAKEYMSMRKEIWQPLAHRTGEKWNVVEAKCMTNGLKNLQSAARSAGRRERLETGNPMNGYDDDSGISGIGLTPVDDHEAYSSPETASSSHSSYGGGGSSGSATYGSATGYTMTAQHSGHQQQYHAHYGNHAPSMSSSYGSSVSSAHGYHTHHAHHHSADVSPYLSDSHGRLPSADMGIDAIINRPGGHSNTSM